MGLKEVITYIKDNGKNFLLKKVAEKLEVAPKQETTQNG
jgi:hypothetical protein